MSQAELEKLQENDPQAIADLEGELKLVKEAANRWTDNIFSCQDYLVKKKAMPKKEAYTLLGINGDFDCEFRFSNPVFVECCFELMYSFGEFI